MADQHSNPELEASRRAELAGLWSRSQHLIEAYIRSSVFHAHDRDDVLQETAKQAALNFDRYDSTRPFANWAIGIAHHKIQELRRRVNRDAKMLGGDTLELVAEAFVRVQDDSADRIAAMEACLDLLQPRHRKLLGLRYTDDMAVQDIADEIGSKPNTVSVALYKVRLALADCIRRRLGLSTPPPADTDTGGEACTLTPGNPSLKLIARPCLPVSSTAPFPRKRTLL